MPDQVVNHTTENDLMAQVREGMAVYDSDGHKVGKVVSLYMGATSDAPNSGTVPVTTAGSDPMDPNTLDLYDPDGRLPDVVRRRMYQAGFIRIDGGLLKGTRYALREQIAGVGEDRIDLNIAQGGMLKV